MTQEQKQVFDEKWEKFADVVVISQSEYICRGDALDIVEAVLSASIASDWLEVERLRIAGNVLTVFDKDSSAWNNADDALRAADALIKRWKETKV